MQQDYRLKLNRQFQYVYRRGSSSGCKEMVLLFAKGRYTKVGFSVSKKIGNAVVRNRVKRRLRECIIPYLKDLKCGSYVIIARSDSINCDFYKLQSQLLNLLKKQKLVNDKECYL